MIILTYILSTVVRSSAVCATTSDEYQSLLLYLGFNRCPCQLLRSHKRHEENKSKIGLERSSKQQAD